MKCLDCGKWTTLRERHGRKVCPCGSTNLAKSPVSGYICPFNPLHGRLLVVRCREAKAGGKFVGPEITYCPVCDANWKEGDHPYQSNAIFN
jgi:hypothetical protein